MTTFALRRSLRLCVAGLGLAAGTAAQDSFDIDLLLGPEPGVGFEFGRATCIVDVDKDGFDDVVALQSGASNGPIDWSGKGWVFYGPNLESWTSFSARDPAEEEYLGGGGCCTGDVNGDGWTDLLVGSPDYIDEGKQDAGRAHVFLGPAFDVDIALHDPFPEAGASMGDHGLLLLDVDADGMDDVFVGCIRHDQRLPDGTIVEDSGRVYLWLAKQLLGAGGLASLTIIDNPTPADGATFGWFLLRLPAADGTQILASAPLTPVGLFEGAIHMLDAATLAPIGFIEPPSAAPQVVTVGSFGTAIASGMLGPNDEFGLLVQSESTYLAVGGVGCNNAGAAFVLTGLDFNQLAYTLVSPQACNDDKQHFGTRAMVLDVDRDGQEDLVINDPSKRDEDLVRIFWGPDYAAFETLGAGFTPVVTSGFGSYLAHGDIDADGFDEIAVFTYFIGAFGGLYIHDWRTLTSNVESLSIAAGGDADFTLDLSPAQAGKTYLAALGISGSDPGTIAGKGSYVPLNLDAVTFAGLALLGSPLLEDFTGSLDADGRATFSLHLPGGFPAPLAGSTLTVAAVVVDPGGRPGAGSSPVEIELVP